MRLGGYANNRVNRRKGFASYYDVLAATKKIADTTKGVVAATVLAAATIAVTGAGSNAERVNAIREINASGRGISNANLNGLTLPKDIQLKGEWHNAKAHGLKVEGKTRADFTGSAMHAEFTGGIAGSTFDNVVGTVEARDQAAHGTSWGGFGGKMDVAGSDIDNSHIKAVLMFSNFNNASMNNVDAEIDSIFTDYDGIHADSGNFKLKSDFSLDHGIKYSRFGARASVSATGMAVTGAKFEKGATVFSETIEKAEAGNATIEDGVKVPVGLCSTAMTTREAASPFFALRGKWRPKGFAVGPA